LLFFSFFVGGAVVAAINIRTGRWDRRGAWRLAAVAFALCFLSALISKHHSFSLAEEIYGFFASVAYAATRALMTWVLYVAIEPVIRRLRPSSLVSWSRLLAGRASDPAVGRDVLVGLSVLALQWLIPAIVIWVSGLKGAGFPVYAFASGENPLSTAAYMGAVVRLPVVTLGSALGFVLTYVVARWLLGPLHRLAPVLLWLLMFWFMFGAYGSSGQNNVVLAVFAVVGATGATYLAVRHGLLAYATYFSVSQVALITVPTVDPKVWYFAPTAILIGLIFALTVFGIVTSTDRNVLVSRL
jgi:hypothetical protein